jgi:hypothetical protein
MSPDTPNDDSRTTGLSRRRFLTRVALGAVGFAGSMSWMPRTAWSDASAASPGAEMLPIALLQKSPFVYISPLRRNGEESSCHSELWFAWLDGSVVVTVASTGWKARALAAGLDRARIWVGNHGRWKSWVGQNNEAFRSAPHFDARAEKVSDTKTLDALLAAYDRKYPAEIASWRDKMRQGNADGSRIMIRYTPIEG